MHGAAWPLQHLAHPYSPARKIAPRALPAVPASYRTVYGIAARRVRWLTVNRGLQACHCQKRLVKAESVSIPPVCRFRLPAYMHAKKSRRKKHPQMRGNKKRSTSTAPNLRGCRNAPIADPPPIMQERKKRRTGKGDGWGTGGGSRLGTGDKEKGWPSRPALSILLLRVKGKGLTNPNP